MRNDVPSVDENFLLSQKAQ